MKTLRETLTALELEGRLTPRDVVAEAAATPGSTLHQHIYGVSDQDAADRYRIDRARNLIRSFRVSYTDRKGDKQTVRQFVHIQPAMAYKATAEAVQDEFTERLIYAEFERALRDLKRRYSHLKEFADIVKRGLLTDEAS